jgi:hypothetical protein
MRNFGLQYRHHYVYSRSSSTSHTLPTALNHFHFYRLSRQFQPHFNPSHSATPLPVSCCFRLNWLSLHCPGQFTIFANTTFNLQLASNNHARKQNVNIPNSLTHHLEWIYT